MLGRVDGIWYATPEERALLEATHPVAERAAARVGNVGVEAPAGVDSERFRRRHGVEGPYLLYGGRTTRGKGLDELLDGAAAMRSAGVPVSLVLIGDAGAAATTPPGVIRLGRLDGEDRWDAIAGALAVVVASRQESLSLLALEAWATGRPALLHAASPALAGQAGRSGGALTFDGPADLAAAARRLVDDPGLADRLGESGRRHVQAEYRWDEALDRLDSLIAEASRRRAAGGGG
jgi:glycosyltransferase involved in cell wall biosynthesis